MSGKSNLRKFREFLSSDYRDQLKKRDKLRKMLGQMRKKQRRLESELEAEKQPDARELLEMQIRLLREQRRKGINLLRELRQARKKGDKD
ncbi:hypothetical protein IC757_00105 [Wenzhouxiangella sp. AB-CW3]|uniref:hypothetical protein n=1 Tax=Wenzhouxiangella sp. AB-CW3 TaxID=2771012 RepID=UPI00168B20A9|nr:hypothetical protein [Wenzhouxiangella sp. AB-CW3]QOC22621.1 hypothetical protein IC757_00105 [Wenzhouxiangella sp. AB-CW3]